MASTNAIRPLAVGLEEASAIVGRQKREVVAPMGRSTSSAIREAGGDG